MIRYLFLTALLLWLLSPAAGVAAATEEVTVQVQVSGESALAARSSGLKKAVRDALITLLEKRKPEKAADIVAKLGADGASQLVALFDVRQEKSTARAYTAEIVYRFDREKIDRLLAEEQGLAPGLDSEALLILPLYQEGEHLMLWEPQNAWRNSLNAVALQEGKGVLVMPFGDPRDALLSDMAAVLSGERATMTRLAERYGTKNVVIAQAIAAVGKDGTPRLRILLRRPGESGKAEPNVRTIKPLQTGESAEAMLERAAREVARQLTESVGQYNLFADEEARQVKAKVLRADYRHNRDWMQIRRALDGLPHVEYVDIGAVSPDFAQLTLYFRGSDTAIRQALLARGLRVRDDQEFWRIALPE